LFAFVLVVVGDVFEQDALKIENLKGKIVV
jgi:hypothetical protein